MGVSAAAPKRSKLAITRSKGNHGAAVSGAAPAGAATPASASELPSAAREKAPCV